MEKWALMKNIRNWVLIYKDSSGQENLHALVVEMTNAINRTIKVLKDQKVECSLPIRQRQLEWQLRKINQVEFHLYLVVHNLIVDRILKGNPINLQESLTIIESIEW